MKNIWDIIVDYVSRSEVNEVKSVLGALVIDKLVELSLEYSNLEEIALDIGPLPTSVTSRLKVKKIDDRIRFIRGFRDYLNVERIHEVKEDIVIMVNEETSYIEEDITILYSYIEKQADRMMQGSSNDTKGAGLCCSCGTPRQGTKEPKAASTTLLTSSSSSTLTTHTLNDYCINCKLKRERRDKKLTDKLPKSVLNRASSADIVPSNDLVDTHNSKIRNKLQAAKDELYFLEEDL